MQCSYIIIYNLVKRAIYSNIKNFIIYIKYKLMLQRVFKKNDEASRYVMTLSSQLRKEILKNYTP